MSIIDKYNLYFIIFCDKSSRGIFLGSCFSFFTLLAFAKFFLFAEGRVSGDNDSFELKPKYKRKNLKNYFLFLYLKRFIFIDMVSTQPVLKQSLALARLLVSVQSLMPALAAREIGGT